jgi:hypothetical protein
MQLQTQQASRQAEEKIETTSTALEKSATLPSQNSLGRKKLPGAHETKTEQEEEKNSWKDDPLVDELRVLRVTPTAVLVEKGFQQKDLDFLLEKGKAVSAHFGNHDYYALSDDGTANLADYPRDKLPSLIACMYVRYHLERANHEYKTMIKQHENGTCEWKL